MTKRLPNWCPAAMSIRVPKRAKMGISAAAPVTEARRKCWKCLEKLVAASGLEPLTPAL